MAPRDETGWTAQVARLAGLGSLLAPLLLAMLLLLAGSAWAAIMPAAGSADPRIAELLPELDEEAEMVDVCVSAEEAHREGTMTIEEVGELCGVEEEPPLQATPDGAAPPDCLLRSARGRVAAHRERNLLRVTLGYTTYEPTPARIEIRAGAVKVATLSRQLGRSGVLRLVKRFPEGQMQRLRNAASFTVRLGIAEAPAACQRFQTARLTAKSTTKHQAVWLQRR